VLHFDFCNVTVVKHSISCALFLAMLTGHFKPKNFENDALNFVCLQLMK